MPALWWTPDQVETLRRLWSEGASAAAMAEGTAHTIAAVYQKAAKLGLARNQSAVRDAKANGSLSPRSPDVTWTVEMCDRLSALWADGLSGAAIARQLGVSKNAVVGKAHRIGLPARQSPIQAPSSSMLADVPKAIELMRQGCSKSEIARRLGRKVKTISGALQRAGTPWTDYYYLQAVEARRAQRQADLEAAESLLPASYRRLVGVGPAPKTCQWIEGEPGPDDACKCGACVLPGRPYCEAHFRRSFTRLRRRATAQFVFGRQNPRYDVSARAA